MLLLLLLITISLCLKITKCTGESDCGGGGECDRFNCVRSSTISNNIDFQFPVFSFRREGRTFSFRLFFLFLIFSLPPSIFLTTLFTTHKYFLQGVKIRMDDDGNILIKRLAKSNVYVKGWFAGEQQQLTNGGGNFGGGAGASALGGSGGGDQSSSVSNEIIRNAGLLEPNKAVRLFDMKKFQANMSRELRRAYPDRRKLENQCICCIALVKDAADLLDLPVWVMVINIVAMDMLKSKMPPSEC